MPSAACTSKEGRKVFPKYTDPIRAILPDRLIAPPPQPDEHLLYPDTDSDSTGWYIVCPQEATNLIGNPTFFNNLTGWTAFNSKMVRQANFAFDAGYAMKLSGSGDQVTGERREYAEYEIFGFQDDTFYVFSAYLWSPHIWDYSDDISLTISIVDVIGGGEEEVFSETYTRERRWQRLEVSKYIRAGAEQVLVRVNLRSTDAHINNPPFNLTGDYNLESEFLFVDLLQFETGQTATTPFYGDSGSWGCGNNASGKDSCGNYSWLGTPHDSASYRSACARDGGVLCSFSSLGFEILSMTGTESPTVQNIATPYANRPGEHCDVTSVSGRLLSFTGYVCNTGCEFFELLSGVHPNSGGNCCGEFLLVFRYDDCTDICEGERDLALCVSYVGGLDGTISSLYNQRYTIQFRAADPFYFEWPGQSSTILPFGDGAVSQGLALVQQDGSVAGYPVATQGIEHVACASNGVAVFAGSFSSPDGGVTTDSPNLAILDCNEYCPTYNLFDGITIYDLERDSAGNVLIGSDLGASIYYPSLGTFGSFPGGPGGAFAVAAPPWAEVVVGTSTGVYIQLHDGTWYSYATDGAVYDLAVDPQGNVIAVGAFTVIDGVIAHRAAIFNVNKGDCQDFETAEWESFPSGGGFDGTLNAVAVDQVSGQAYVGGDALTSTPYPESTCIVTNGQSFDSKGSSQELRFTDLGGGSYRIEVRMDNVVTQVFGNQCLTTAATRRFIRITATSTLGTQYSLLLGDYNITASSISTGVKDPGPPIVNYYALTIDFDSAAVLGDPCETLNPSFVSEAEDTVSFVQLISTLDLGGGVGIDNNISSISIQCVNLQDVFQGDTQTINYVAAVSGGAIAPMGDGLTSPVTKLFVHPQTGDVYAMLEDYSDEYPSALARWNGSSWTTPDFEAPGGRITGMSFCAPSCGLLVSYTSHALIGPSAKEFSYCGTADLYDPVLVVHGSAKLRHFDINDRSLRLCTNLECGETAIYDSGFGSFRTTDNRDLTSTILSGSRKNLIAQAKCTNKVSLKAEPDSLDVDSSAVLLWRNRHWGISSKCCVCLDVTDGTYLGESDYVKCCSNSHDLIQIFDPTEQCNQNGWDVGDLWLNIAAGCPRLWLLTDETCEDCSNVGLIDGDGGVLHDDTPENYCPDNSA